MASTLNKIGDIQFLSIEGAIVPPAQELELVARPGVPGVAAWLTGVRGQPFQLRTAMDCATLDDANLGVDVCKALIGSGPVNIIKNDYSYELQQLTFLVLRVEPVNGTPCKMANSTGGLNPPSAAWLELQWDLVAIRTS